MNKRDKNREQDKKVRGNYCSLKYQLVRVQFSAIIMGTEWKEKPKDTFQMKNENALNINAILRNT